MSKKRKPNGYWTKEKCHEETLKYNTKIDLKNKQGSVYRIICKNNWLDELCSHMISSYKPIGYWTKNKCHDEALKYSNKKDFRYYSSYVYKIACSKNWINDICLHMKTQVKEYNSSLRCIYVYEFSDNYAHIGLTNNLNRRHNEHINNKNGVVYLHMLETNLKPNLKKLTEYLDEKNAQLLECKYLEYYKLNGWNILNRSKAGILGSCNLYWTYERCQEEALKYNSKIEFKSNCPSAYASALNKKWLNDICVHMKRPKPYNFKWGIEMCKVEALNYNSRSEFKKKNPYVYEISRKNKWLDNFYIKYIK